MKILKYFLAIITVIITLLTVWINTLTGYGEIPKGEDLERISKSPQYSEKAKGFVNRLPSIISDMKDRNMSLDTFKMWMNKGDVKRSPEKKLPQIKPDMEKFLKNESGLSMIWFGHSTILLRLNNKTILFDPIFSNASSPVSFLVTRFQAPVLSLKELPAIDYIVISHDHYDHLDELSIKYFIDKKVKFLVPLGVGSHLKYWGINPNHIMEMDWWQTHSEEDIEFVTTPSQHFSGRDLSNDNKTLWASWVVKSKDHSIYFSGDSGYDIHFKTIGDKYGPFDLAFIESGQYNKRWEEVHLLPKQSILAYQELKAKKYFPIHWGMFELSVHSWSEPIENSFKAHLDKKINLVTTKLGEVFSINDNLKPIPWWEL